MNVPFVSLNPVHKEIKEVYLQKVSAILDSGGFILGKEVKDFENKFSAYCQSSFCLGTGNGLEAIEISLRALGIGKGDEVIVPAHTFIATWLAVAETGASIVPVDADESNLNINTSLIESVITPKTKAIIPVHLYGQPCDMGAIMKIAKKHRLFVVEDFAQAQGAKFNSKTVGSFGHINATSFYPAKNIGAAGDAGAIVTSDEKLFRKASLIRNYGSTVKYYHEVQGMNSRLDEIQAVLLNLKLPLLDGWNKERRRIAERYCRNLKDEKNIKLPVSIKNAEHVYHLFVIQTEKRNKLAEFLKKKDITTLIHYPVPPHLQKAFSGYFKRKPNLPVAEKLADTVLSLPIFVGITDSQIDYVCENVVQFFKK